MIVYVPMDKFGVRFGRWIKSLGSAKPFFKSFIFPFLLKKRMETFKDQGPGWAEWSEKWALFRAMDGTGGPGNILIWQDRLRQSLQGGLGHVKRFGKDAFVWGTNVEYAAVQQQGLEPDGKTLRGGLEDFQPFAPREFYGGGKGIPPRPFLFISEEEVGEIGVAFVDDIINRAADYLSGV